MTPSLKLWHNYANIYVLELHIQEVACVQNLKFVLALKLKKTCVFHKNIKKVSHNIAIFDVMTFPPKF